MLSKWHDVKDLLTSGQLEALAGAAGSEDFVLADARGATLTAMRVHRRDWLARGFRLVPLPPLPAGIEGRALARFGVAVVAVVRAPGTTRPKVAGDLEALGVHVQVVARSEDGRLSAEGKPLPPPDGARRRAALIISLDGDERIEDVELPLELALDVDGHASREFGLRLDGGPAPGRWKVDGHSAGRVKLHVDAGVARGNDRWVVTGRDGATVSPVVEAGASDVAGDPRPFRLAVILDRTCPDEAGWSAARALSLGRAGADSGYQDLNRGIRSSLEQALVEGLRGRDIMVDAWAFADTAGDGLAPLDGIELPEFPVLALTSATPGQLPGTFASATYSPGLDVWDPVDEALEQALDALELDRSRRGVILIVGNSPPHVLPVPGGAFGELARVAGCASAVRRYSPVWEMSLERCRASNTAVVYVFLEQRAFRTDEQRAHELFMLLSRRVREGLEASMGAVAVMKAAANGEGVRRAVAEALEKLVGAGPKSCGVRLAGVNRRP